jgi:hypothetical protein
MTSKTKTVLAALIVAAIASPALAEGYYGYGHVERAPVVEGRNAAVANPVVISGREALVRAN